MLHISTFKESLSSVAMRETGKQVGSGCRQTAECTECLCKHCGCSLAELKQQEIKTDCTPDGYYWRLLLIHNSVKHTHTHKQRATFTRGLLDSMAHTVVHKSWTDMILGTACTESSKTEFYDWRKVPSERSTKGLFIAMQIQKVRSYIMATH